jgi:hypothetical protein
MSIQTYNRLLSAAHPSRRDLLQPAGAAGLASTATSLPTLAQLGIKPDYTLRIAPISRSLSRGTSVAGFAPKGRLRKSIPARSREGGKARAAFADRAVGNHLRVAIELSLIVAGVAIVAVVTARILYLCPMAV